MESFDGNLIVANTLSNVSHPEGAGELKDFECIKL